MDTDGWFYTTSSTCHTPASQRNSTGANSCDCGLVNVCSSKFRPWRKMSGLGLCHGCRNKYVIIVVIRTSICTYHYPRVLIFYHVTIPTQKNHPLGLLSGSVLPIFRLREQLEEPLDLDGKIVTFSRRFFLSPIHCHIPRC